MTDASPPLDVDALLQAARTAVEAGNLGQALALVEPAIARDLTNQRLLRFAAELYRRQSRFEERATLLRHVALLAPDDVAGWREAALAYADLGDLEGLREAAERAIALQPDDPATHYLLANALLRESVFQQGWREYEWRLKIPGVAGGAPPEDWTRWDGTSMTEQRLLIFCDQGRGDVIQFARYIPWVAERCPNLAICCPGEMWPILLQFPQIRVLAEHWHQVGPCAAFVPIGSLPLIAGTRVDTIPAPVPYLRADPSRAAAWRDRLNRLLPQRYPRVGLVWAGNPSHHNDQARSLELAWLKRLFELRGIAFVALQLGAAQAQLGGLFSRAPLVNLAPDLRGFHDTMAILEAIDLVISVDTSVAHLAGAMGRPVWVLLPFAADWRWLAGRETSPWYPTMRLFLQATPAVWEPVIRRVAVELEQFRDA